MNNIQELLYNTQVPHQRVFANDEESVLNAFDGRIIHLDLNNLYGIMQ